MGNRPRQVPRSTRNRWRRRQRSLGHFGRAFYSEVRNLNHAREGKVTYPVSVTADKRPRTVSWPDRHGDLAARDETRAQHTNSTLQYHALLQISLTLRGYICISLDQKLASGMDLNYFPKVYFGAHSAAPPKTARPFSPECHTAAHAKAGTARLVAAHD